MLANENTHQIEAFSNRQKILALNASIEAIFQLPPRSIFLIAAS